MKGTPEERFWAKVRKGDPDECWIWIASKGGHGYGTFRADKDTVTKAHRFSWELHNGKIPKGMMVLHRCDIPLCVNPAHLFIGNHTDNMQDMMIKCRHKKDTNVPDHLVAESVLKLRNNEMTKTEISKWLESQGYPVTIQAIAMWENGTYRKKALKNITFFEKKA